MVGHCYPIWLKFSGGKGVATGLGIIAMLSPISGFLFIITCSPILVLIEKNKKHSIDAENNNTKVRLSIFQM